MLTIETLANPQTITRALRQSGLMEHGSVLALEWQSLPAQGFKSPNIAFLKLEYTPGTSATAPARMLLKIGKSPKEHVFYSQIAKTLPFAQLPACHYSEYLPEEDQSFLLLEDCSTTHFQTEWPLPPARPLCEQTVISIARFHAACWNQPQLETLIHPLLPIERSWVGRVNLAIEKLPAFFDFMGDRISERRKQLFIHLLSLQDQTWRPQSCACALTLVHGDAHFWNFLYPFNGEPAEIKIIDWNGWDIGRGTDDLAYMIGLHWYPERRAALETPLLQLYHRGLVDCGVQGYSLDDCWQDYRRSTRMNLFIPVWQWVRGINPGIWWSHMERAFLALDDSVDGD